jgi:hypothetical protein
MVMLLGTHAVKVVVMVVVVVVVVRKRREEMARKFLWEEK